MTEPTTESAPATTKNAAIKILQDEIARLHIELTSSKTAQQAATAEITALKAALDKAGADAKAAVDAAVAAGVDRLKTAELRAALTKAGAVDPDLVKLLDVSKVQTKDDGSFEGIEALVADTRKNRPHLFGAGSTSASGTAPKPGDTSAFDARTASAEEVDKRLRLLTGGKA